MLRHSRLANRWWGVLLWMAGIFAILDELHRAFVPGRGFELADNSTGLSLRLRSVQA